MKAQFEREVVSLRADKDSFLRDDIDSPIPPNERSSFKGLNYFPPNEDYRVTSRLERFDSPKPVTMATSTGTQQAYIKYGALKFKIKERTLKLIVYKSAEDPYARSLFIPFSDETSSRETYGAGRYLDLEEQGGDTNCTSTWHTTPIAHTVKTILVQSLRPRTSSQSRFLQERRITNRNTLR